MSRTSQCTLPRDRKISWDSSGKENADARTEAPHTVPHNHASLPYISTCSSAVGISAIYCQINNLIFAV